MESYYSLVKRTQSIDSPTRLHLERLKTLMINCSTYKGIPLKELLELAKEEDCSIGDLVNEPLP